MNINELKWSGIILFMVLTAIILPYTVLSNVSKWYGSFLLWIFLTIIVILINYFITRSWGKEE